MNDICTTIHDVYRGNGNHIDSHEEVGAAQVNNEERRDFTTLCLDPPEHNKHIANNRKESKHPNTVVEKKLFKGNACFSS